MPRKKAPSTKPRTVQYTSFLLEIGQWRLPYSLSVGLKDRHARGPYWEHVALVLEGSIVYPKKYQGPDVEIYIIGSREEVGPLSGQEDPGEWQPACVGTLTLRGSERKYLGTLPQSGTRSRRSLRNNCGRGKVSKKVKPKTIQSKHDKFPLSCRIEKPYTKNKKPPSR